MAVTGGLRASLGTTGISITSSLRLLVGAAVVAAIRHAFHRRPSLLDVLWTLRLRRLSDAWSVTGLIWAVSRASVIVAGYFAVLLFELPHPPQFRVSDNSFLNLPARWDAGWYLDIAVNGYRWHGVPYKQQNIAFFPAFPMAMRAAGALLGGWRPGIRPVERAPLVLYGGWLVALAAFWYALVYLYRWALVRAGPAVATATVTLLAAYPFAVFYSAPYTEGVYLLAAVAVFYHFEREEWWRAAGWGVLIGLVRPNGALIAIPLAMLAVRQLFRQQPRRVLSAAWVAVGAPAAALCAHALFIRALTGRFFAWSDAQAAWGRSYQLTTWVGLEMTRVAETGILRYPAEAPVTILNGLALMMTVLLLWIVTRAIGLAYLMFIVVNLVPAVLSGGLLSVGRFTSTLFPLFFSLALVIPPRHLNACVLGFSVLQGLFAALFFTWRPPF